MYVYGYYGDPWCLGQGTMVTHGNQRLLGITHDVLEGHMWMDGDSTLKDPIFTKGVHLVWVYVYGYHGDPWCLGQGTMASLAMCMCI